jgi:hypothetical protein
VVVVVVVVGFDLYGDGWFPFLYAKSLSLSLSLSLFLYLAASLRVAVFFFFPLLTPFLFSPFEFGLGWVGSVLGVNCSGSENL